jgi:NTF2-related export protein 1/2
LISTFYAPTLSTILFNGNEVADGSSVQDIFVNQMPPAHYEVQTFDCQIINPSYPTAIPAKSAAAVRNMSLLVTVSGYVKFGDDREIRDLPSRGFSDTFVLVPNPTESRPGAKGKGKKQWLIQSQNFRLVV